MDSYRPFTVNIRVFKAKVGTEKRAERTQEKKTRTKEKQKSAKYLFHIMSDFVVLSNVSQTFKGVGFNPLKKKCVLRKLQDFECFVMVKLVGFRQGDIVPEGSPHPSEVHARHSLCPQAQMYV